MRSCCDLKNVKKPRGIWSGIVSGLIPHIGCIAFIIFAVLGATAATSFFKPLMLSSYFFYGLVVLSLVFATISATFYLRKNKALSLKGIKCNKTYLSILYGTTIAVNLVLFLIVFPMVANTFSTSSAQLTDKLTLQVQIPCSGHAPLIIGELNKVGINSKFRFPNLFDVEYNSSEITKEEILNLDIFKSFKAKIIN